MALKYRCSLIFSIICAMLVAVCWGANIGTVLPIIEVVSQNKSLHDLVDERIEQSEASIDSLQRENDQLIANVKNGVRAQHQVAGEIAFNEKQVAAYRKKLNRTRRWEPWIRNYTPNDAFQTLLVVIGVLFMGTILRCLFLSINMFLVARIGQRTILDIQDQLFRKTMRMELSELKVRGTGDLISRIRGETNAIAVAITTLYGKILREPLKMTACLVGAALVNWRLLLFSMIVVPGSIFLILTIARITKKANKRAMEESARLLDRLFQAVSYLRLVKAFNMESHEHKRFRNVATEVYRKAMRISLFNALGRSNNELLGVGMISLSTIVGAYLVLNQETHLLGIRLCSTEMVSSEIMLFFAFLVGIADPLRKMGDVYNMIQSGIVASDRVFPLFDQMPTVQDPDTPRGMPAGPPEIKFESVDFEYESGIPVIHDFSLTIPPGSCLAIVGANGCGKSTLVNLVLRFFDPASGQVKIAGHDIREYRLEDLRESMGYVTQQTMLFSDTIINNIRYGSVNATESEVLSAARAARAHDFVQQMPHGYDSSIGEHGGKLSGGQRQRIALARAILKNPPIMILDEATSQIDPESEQLIHRTLSEFIRERTTVMITHRLSTLELADQILVMGEGRLLDCGTHQELLGRCRQYRQLRATHMEEAA